MKLTNLILEADLSPLANLDDLIKKELEAAEKEAEKPNQQNEGVLTFTAFALAIPGILRAIDKLGRTIFTKAGINLDKKEPNSITRAYNVVIQTAEKADSYIIRPIEIILKPFISDVTKRKKVAEFMKAVVLIIMTVSGGVNINTAPSIKSAIQAAAPEVADELLGLDNVLKLADKLATIVEKNLKTILG
jgi:hypothetical protein